MQPPNESTAVEAARGLAEYFGPNKLKGKKVLLTVGG
ncbi:hypothetical protein N7457_008694 [Penicillium paradoxum]|nr:uncharacterized protein N7457_008694 [Penicillium paradoxum]KAJ5773798.1 hypothetical protein N7457_008694 [Penicillium paradoxum]